MRAFSIPGPKVWRCVLCVGLATWSVSALAGPAPTGPKNGTVLIIRHAEKPPDSDPSLLLNAIGNERAAKYVDYFKNLKIEGKSATPEFVFATKKAHESDRPWLTVEPLVSALKLPNNHAIKNNYFADLTKLLTSGEYDGKTVLVCWYHGDIPRILHLLGADPQKLLGSDKWPRDVFGWMVELQFGPNGELKESTILNEKLMAGDTEEPHPKK